MNAFNVGDIVEVIDEPWNVPCDTYWNDDMNEFAGGVYEISYVRDKDDECEEHTYHLEGVTDEVGYSWIFNEAWLIPHDETTEMTETEFENLLI